MRLARACARYGRMWEEKEEEFLKSYIEDSFRPCFKGVRDFDASKFFKILQGFPVILQGFSMRFWVFLGLLRVEVP